MPSSKKISLSTKVGATALATIGVSLEWFDFFAYGTAAALVFPHYFFPPKYPYFWALVLSLVTYLVGFVARPVGAIVFGHIGDRYGRKAGLTWDLVLMGLGTLAIGLTPGYQQIGYLGITLVSIFRILQGLGLGGEWGGATTFIEEFAADSRWRAFWGSWVQQGVPIGLLMGSGLFTLFSSIYKGEAFITFGWKLVFWIGAIVAIIAVILRAIFLETPRS
jgi:MFS family permease